MAGMKMPEWYSEAKESLARVASAPLPSMTPPLEMEKIVDLPSLFAKYSVKEADVLIHLFPRAGLDDQWTEGHYINRCRSCRAEVPMPRSRLELRPCPRCRHTGLVYVPGRSEEASKVTFPPNVRDLIKRAVDAVWMGDVAIELVPELGAYVVQVQRAKNAAKLMGPENFVRRVCAKLDGLLPTPAS